MALGSTPSSAEVDLALAGATGEWPDLNPVTKIYRNDDGTFQDIVAVPALTDWGLVLLVILMGFAATMVLRSTPGTRT